MKEKIKSAMLEMVISVGEKFGSCAVEQCCIGRFHEPEIPQELLHGQEEE